MTGKNWRLWGVGRWYATLAVAVIVVVSIVEVLS